MRPLLLLVALTSACTGATSSHDADSGVVAAHDAGADDSGAAVDAGEDAGMSDAGTPAPEYVFAGSAAGKIHVFAFDAEAGALQETGAFDGGPNPSFLAFHPSRPLLYAVNERTPGEVSAFAIDPQTAALTRLGSASSGGNGPAHLSVDRSGRWVLAANYGSGTVAVLPITSDGGVGAPVQTYAPGPKAHQILTDASNRWAFVPTLGADKVAQFAFDADAGTVTPNAVPAMDTASGAGPRHLDFHPTKPFAYLINELDSTLIACSFDASTGRLSPLQTVSTLPSAFTGNNTTAEVFVHPNGRFVFGSNRGHDSIVVFAVDQTSGTLTLVGHTATGGASPRSFALNADGSVLVAANQTSGTITGFRVNVETGALTPLGVLANVPSPAFVGFTTPAR